MAVFGTNEKARKTYDHLEKELTDRFPGHPVIQVFTSRIVSEKMKKRNASTCRTLEDAFAEIGKREYPWVVVQSFHFICGHEFYRLVDWANHQNTGVRASFGHPLLSGIDDYHEVARILTDYIMDYREDEAVVFVGHGTDHPAWASYLALDGIMKEQYGNRVWIGVLDGGFPDKRKVVESVKKAGFTRVRVVPFMLTAGYHFINDLAGDNHSWKKTFETKNIDTVIEEKAMGYHPKILDLYTRHIVDALDVIPKNTFRDMEQMRKWASNIRNFA